MTDFEDHRAFLVGLAYRMLGSVTDAEDVVQDAFLRWRATDPTTVEHPRAYLARIVSRLCLDKMKSATARREHYVGTWLPEPVVAEPTTQVAEDLSLALLLTLERLSPLERAAFLLHDVFDMDYADVATTLDRSESACRQLAARAREHVRDARPRFSPDADTRAKVTDAFASAMATGDVATLAQILADDAILYTDGGGKKLAALNPIYGKDKILRFIAGVSNKGNVPRPDQIERTSLNGMPGFIARTDDGVETMAIDIVDDRIVAIYSVRNPDKVKHLA
jgi:RNA polymerase sigma-70 factor (ECF subfamily)